MRWVRWIARGIGTLASAFWLFALGANGISDALSGRGAPSLEGIGLGSLVVLSVVGVALAWRRERLGGAVASVGGIALCIFAFFSAGHNKGYAMLVSGGPFLVAGLLFLAYAQSSGHSKSNAPPAEQEER